MKDPTVIKLRDSYERICNEYLCTFCAKHEYDVDYEIQHGGVWVCDNPGTIATISDMWINFEDIRYDIDNHIPEETFEEWYWKSLERAEMKLKFLNYPAYCKGAPDPISPERYQMIMDYHKKKLDAEKLFQEVIKDYKNDEI